VFLLNVGHLKRYKLKFNKNVKAKQTLRAAEPFLRVFVRSRQFYFDFDRMMSRLLRWQGNNLFKKGLEKEDFNFETKASENLLEKYTM